MAKAGVGLVLVGMVALMVVGLVDGSSWDTDGIRCEHRIEVQYYKNTWLTSSGKMRYDENGEVDIWRSDNWGGFPFLKLKFTPPDTIYPDTQADPDPLKGGGKPRPNVCYADLVHIEKGIGWVQIFRYGARELGKVTSADPHPRTVYYQGDAVHGVHRGYSSFDGTDVNIGDLHEHFGVTASECKGGKKEGECMVKVDKFYTIQKECKRNFCNEKWNDMEPAKLWNNRTKSYCALDDHSFPTSKARDCWDDPGFFQSSDSDPIACFLETKYFALGRTKERRGCVPFPVSLACCPSVHSAPGCVDKDSLAGLGPATGAIPGQNYIRDHVFSGAKDGTNNGMSKFCFCPAKGSDSDAPCNQDGSHLETAFKAYAAPEAGNCRAILYEKLFDTRPRRPAPIKDKEQLRKAAMDFRARARSGGDLVNAGPKRLPFLPLYDDPAALPQPAFAPALGPTAVLMAPCFFAIFVV